MGRELTFCIEAYSCPSKAHDSVLPYVYTNIEAARDAMNTPEIQAHLLPGQRLHVLNFF